MDRSKKLAYTLLEAEQAGPFSRSTLYRKAAEGRIRILRDGGRSFIPAEDLHNLIDNATPYHQGWAPRKTNETL
jgi:hypothetical protein